MLVLAACLAAPLPAMPADGEPGAGATGAPIPFRKDDRGATSGLSTTIGVLVLLALMGWGGLYALRRLKLAPQALMGKARRVRLVETLRIDPRLTLYVVAADDKTLLLGRCGDTLVVASELPTSDAAAEAQR
jgi:hypothetical protein